MRYAYQKPDGEIHWLEQSFKAGPPPLEIEVGEVMAKRCYQAERPRLPSSSGWPMECLASGVNAADAGKLRDKFIELGVPTEVSSDGNPIYRSHQHRARALKARGLFDRQAYY